MTDAGFADRIEFVIQLARRLHAYGTTAQRLEGAICAVAARLSLVCNPWSNPTGLILSFADARDPAVPETTRVIRLEPGDIDLRKLCQADDIAERVMRGELGLHAGSAALRALDGVPGVRGRWLYVFSFGLTSASVAALLRTGWAGIATAACVGWIIGGLSLLGGGRPRLAEALDALAALLATLLVFAVAHWLTPLPVQSVVVAALIVLLPGLSLTTAVRELSSQHLISGTARMAGAMAILLKLAFGTVAATQLCALFGWVPPPMPVVAVPVWAEWLAVLAAALAFALMFRSPRRYYPAVIASVLLGYLCTRIGGAYVSAPFGVFLGGLVLGAVSNVFARVWKRPGALIREPGIILLVPGSVGFRTLSFVLERDVMLGLDTAVTLLTLLIALVAGLLFGDLLVPPRRKL